jgi:hypothetical protein
MKLERGRIDVSKSTYQEQETSSWNREEVNRHAAFEICS